MNHKRILIVCMILSVHGLGLGAVKGVVKKSGVKGGVVVHLGCGDGRETASLALGDSYLVHGLDVDAARISEARRRLRSKGVYGRVSVARYDGRTLPYGDNMVNLIVADTLGDVPAREAMRVLAPLGAMIIGGEKTVKPWPDEIDDWPQYLNKADNNAVAMDTVAGPPRHIQWVDSPVWSRSHMAIPTVAGIVTGNGRLFAIEDTAPPDNPFLPGAFRIVARDAFNGQELWERRIDRWESITMYIKCQPLQQQRRMAVAGDILYATLDLVGPVSAVDAATGELIRTYKKTAPTQEVAYDQGVLFLNVGDRFNTSAYNIVKLKGRPFVEGADPSQPFYGGGFREGYAPEIKDKENPISAILAIDAASGKELWAVRDISNYTAGSLSIKGDRAVYQAANGLFCVDVKSGREVWSKLKPIVNAVGHDSLTPGTTPNTVVITDDKVFAVEASATTKPSANPKNTVIAYSLKDGSELWQAPAQGNYESSSDVFFVNGSVWVGGNNPTQLDANTGEVVKKIVQKMTGPMGHDRCYRNYITERYFINSKTGGADFLELESSKEIPHHWTRGGCGSGALPANGLLYTTPYSCQCSMGAMFQGMNAYAPTQPDLRASDQSIAIKRSARLEKGPAYGKVVNPTAVAADDWPCYRHDASRGGVTEPTLPTELSMVWEAKLPTKASAATVAAGQAFVCDADTHTLYALDAKSGREEWTYTAAGRIDSPPVYHKGMALFGSRDGWVYCLRVSDGALAWRFKDLPDRLIGAYSQLESAWPVSGSVVVVNDTLYFAAGRSSYLDGGMFVYALDPSTGKMLKSRSIYGPFTEEDGFPGGSVGFKNDLIVSDGTTLYVGHRAFDLDLADAAPGKHLLPSGGFLDGQPQHRTNWAITATHARGGVKSGDIMVSRGKEFYGVQGFPLYMNHSYFDPRRSGYLLFAGATESAPQPKPETKAKGKRRAKGSGKGRAASKELWRTDIPITGKAMAMAGDVLFVAGEPMQFESPTYKDYVDAYYGKRGGRLLAVSANDGKLLASHTLSAAPAWDSIAIASGRLYISLADGTTQCWARSTDR